MTRLQAEVLATLAALTITRGPGEYSADTVAELQGCRPATAAASLGNLANGPYVARKERGPVFSWETQKVVHSYGITPAGMREVLVRDY